MKSLIAFATVFAGSATLMAADSSAIEDVKNAAQKLATAENYSWTTTFDSTRCPGPIHGETEKGGYTSLDFLVQNNEIKVVLKDDRGAIKTKKGWERDAADSHVEASIRDWLLAWHLHLHALPATEAQIFAVHVKDLTGSNGVYSGVLPTAGSPVEGRATRNRDLTCSAKFWIKDGVLTRYEFNYKGSVKGIYPLTEDVDIDQTTTVEFKDVGTTKITGPDEVMDKMF